MTTKTNRSKDAARTPKTKAAAPESAASARLRREARAAVAANLAALEAPGTAPGTAIGSAVAHNEQGGEPHEPQQPAQPQPDQQQREQPDHGAPSDPAHRAKPGRGGQRGAKAKDATPAAAAQPAATSAAKIAKPNKPAKAVKAKRLSCLDAAAQVIGKDPVGCKDLIAEMGQRKLWSSPNGKTPDASLYAAIIREIAAKKSEARFKKVDRGLFVANAGTTKKGA